MIYLKAEPTLGSSHEEWAAEAIDLCKKLGVRLTVRANEVDVPVFPDDTPEKVVEMYHLLAGIMDRTKTLSCPK